MKYALALALAACSAPTAPRAMHAPAVHRDLGPGQKCVTELNGRQSLGDCELESGERGYIVSIG